MMSYRFLRFTFLLLLFSLFYHNDIIGKETQNQGYEIKVQITPLENTSCYLANYYGNNQYLKDTAKVDSKGRMVFEGDEPLPGGIYLVVLPGKSYFEILVDDDQHFSLKTTKLPPKHTKVMKIQGSESNESFYKYLRFVSKKGKISKELEEKFKETKSEKEKEKLRKKKKKLNEDFHEYRDNYIKENSGSLLAKIFKMMREPEVPDKKEKDSAFAYRYYKNHFLDGVDFTDDRLLRTPVFHKKLKKYITKIIPQQPDSIIKAADRIIEKTRGNKEMFKYCVWWITNHYEKSKIMGMEKVPFHMFEKYYLTGDAHWIDNKTLKNIKKRYVSMKGTLIGDKARNLRLTSYKNDKIKSLYSVDNKYTILYFYSPECGHCQDKTPVLRDIYKEKADSLDFEVFAVNIDRKPDKWNEFIEKHNLQLWQNLMDKDKSVSFRRSFDVYSTPTIYILDDKKKIIGKRLDVKQIVDFIKRYEKKNKSKEKNTLIEKN